MRTSLKFITLSVVLGVMSACALKQDNKKEVPPSSMMEIVYVPYRGTASAPIPFEVTLNVFHGRHGGGDENHEFLIVEPTGVTWCRFPTNTEFKTHTGANVIVRIPRLTDVTGEPKRIIFVPEDTVFVHHSGFTLPYNYPE